MRWNNGAGGRRRSVGLDGRRTDGTRSVSTQLCKNNACAVAAQARGPANHAGSGALDSLRALRVSPRQSGAGRLSHNVEVLASRWLAAKFATLHA
jgi:hypothetical protein